MHFFRGVLLLFGFAWLRVCHFLGVWSGVCWFLWWGGLGCCLLPWFIERQLNLAFDFVVLCDVGLLCLLLGVLLVWLACFMGRWFFVFFDGVWCAVCGVRSFLCCVGDVELWGIVLPSSLC